MDKTPDMTEKHTYCLSAGTFSLLYIDEEDLNYDQIVLLLQNEKYSPFVGKECLEQIFKAWQEKEIELPDDQCYIIALDREHRLPHIDYPDGTILYYVPFIYSSTDGEKWLSETCFS
ncbi:MAG TPA: hypothetical protein PK950_02160, partial [Candidatus Paceibacterota bacterium]|nr:hypothetical protein [Candidatus Paceibacterota bacterium]